MSIALHESLGLAAQRHLDEPAETEAIQEASYADIEEHRGHLTTSERDSAYVDLQEARIKREIPIAAISRLIGDRVIHRALSAINEHGPDWPPTFLGSVAYSPYEKLYDGVSRFFDEAVKETITVLKEEGHPYHNLYRLFCTEQQNFNNASNNNIGNEKRAAMAVGSAIDADNTLKNSFSGNYRELIASFLVMNGIAAQTSTSELPDTAALRTHMIEGRDHWIAAASFNRRLFGNLFYGNTCHRRMITEMDKTHRFPPWITLWGQGFADHMSQNTAFQGCTAESPLLYSPAQLVTPDAWESAARCAGQFPLTSDPVSNEAAQELSEAIGGGVTTDAFSATELVLDLGVDAAGRTLYSDKNCRKSLQQARQACNIARSLGYVIIGEDGIPAIEK
jgi:hypothetical protein